MKDVLKKIIERREKELTDIEGTIEGVDSLEEVRSLDEKTNSIKVELEELRSELNKYEELESKKGEFRAINTMIDTKEEKREMDKKVDKTLETRSAFQAVVSGDATPEQRAMTTTEKGKVLIPTSVLGLIQTNLKEYGQLYSKVTHTNVKGGVDIPVADFDVQAEWVADGGKSDDKEISKLDAISFKYNMLEVKLAISSLAFHVGLDDFEREFAEMAAAAIVRKLEEGIINGTGSGQMEGVMKNTKVAKLKATLDYASIRKNVLGKLGAAYRNGIFIGPLASFEAFMGMVDANGQPIARINYGLDGEDVYRLFGKEFVVVEDSVIAPGDTNFDIAYLVPSKYVINSNMNLEIVEWEDHDNNLNKIKARTIVDGKLVDAAAAKVITISPAAAPEKE